MQTKRQEIIFLTSKKQKNEKQKTKIANNVSKIN